MAKNISPIQRAVDIAGGQTKLAEAIGIPSDSRNIVWMWLNKGRPVPARYCRAIEDATGGKVTRKDLRPNDWRDYWPELETA